MMHNSTTLHKKWSFELRISSVNVTKSAVAEPKEIHRDLKNRE